MLWQLKIGRLQPSQLAPGINQSCGICIPPHSACLIIRLMRLTTMQETRRTRRTLVYEQRHWRSDGPVSWREKRTRLKLPPVMIFLLFSNLFLLTFFFHWTYIFLRICYYNYISLLLVVHSFHSCLFVLWPHPTPFYSITGRKYPLIFVILSLWTLSPLINSITPIM